MPKFTVNMSYSDLHDKEGNKTGERELWVQWTPNSGNPTDTTEFLFLLESIMGKDFDSGMMMQPPFTRDWNLPLPNDEKPLPDRGLTSWEQDAIKHQLDPENYPNPVDEDE